MSTNISIRKVISGILMPVIFCLVMAPVRGADFVQAGNQVTCGQARFDVLSTTLIRMQYGSFTDAPTAIVTNRSMSTKQFKTSEKNGWLQISTPKVLLRYRVGSGNFNSENLRAVWQDSTRHHEWSSGIYDDQNLGGPMPSFNSIYEQTMPQNTLPGLPDGFLSRNGFCFFDDSSTPVWDTHDQWITPRSSKESKDWYLFVYGKDFKHFFSEYTTLTGRIPMAPRYVLGAWITDINFEYNNQKTDEKYLWSLVERFRTEHIPLDVFVFDFGWHLHGWDGGLDWSPVFKDPTAFLKKLHENGIKTSANDHPSSGLSILDTRINDALKKLGKPSISDRVKMDISTDWIFQVDPSNQGMAQGWSQTEYDDSSWPRMAKATMWEQAGYPKYDGYGWFRKWVELPAKMQTGKVFLSFGGVDDEYELYINGKMVAKYGSPGNSVYDKLTETEISGYLKPTGRNLIALRVLDWGNNGGFTKLPMVLGTESYGVQGVRFNLADKKEATVYTDYLNEIVDQGLDFWWIDGDYANMPGLNSQMWTNRMYYTAQEKHTGERSFIFSRYGGPGSHRYPGFFTGDAWSTWKVLNYEVPLTVKSGNVLIPYVTHDIGGFVGNLKDNYELYARWVQFGAFSPIFRLHSCHENPEEGNARMPWNYGDKGLNLARKFVTQRYRLIPYLYTYCREAYDTGLPLSRPLYLEYPNDNEAYNHFDEYLLGKEMLVAPIVTPATNGKATRNIYFPAGVWVDYFTGQRYQGGQTVKYTCPLDRLPVFVRQGAIIPMQPDMEFSSQKPIDPLILDIYPGQNGSFKLYEDDGTSLHYKNNQCSWTSIKMQMQSLNSLSITVAPASGTYKAQPKQRGYRLDMHLVKQPKRVTVNGKLASCKWDDKTSLAVVSIGKSSIHSIQQVRVEW